MQSNAQFENDARYWSLLISRFHERKSSEIYPWYSRLQQHSTFILQAVRFRSQQSAINRQQNSQYFTIAYASLQHWTVKTQLLTTRKVPKWIRTLRHHHPSFPQRALFSSVHPRQMQGRGRKFQNASGNRTLSVWHSTDDLFGNTGANSGVDCVGNSAGHNI